MLLVSAVLFHAVVTQSPLNRTRSYLFILANAFHASGLSPLGALFPVMAYGAVFCEEHQSEYLSLILQRTGIRKFIWTRICTTALSGGIMMAVPILCICAVSYTGGLHGLPTGPDEGLLEGSRALRCIERYGDWYFLGWKVVLGFLFGMVWSLAGLAFAVWFQNRYVALLAPIILYDSLWMLIGWVPFNPVFLLSGDNVLSGNFPLAALLEVIYMGIVALLIKLGIRRAVYG